MLLQIQNADLSMGGQTLLSHFDFYIKSTEKIALVGRNGSGKTTFLRLLAGELSPDASTKTPATVTSARRLTTGFLRQQAFSDTSLT
ncbi:MAG TPA: ABC transporter ATP-binding protein, partial [Lachnospiraceae bacterium]|nr:ABC transporter ATP-binding protein [Lachnospiraceae bacterium]